jgi:hypothetical protein
MTYVPEALVDKAAEAIRAAQIAGWDENPLYGCARAALDAAAPDIARAAKVEALREIAAEYVVRDSGTAVTLYRRADEIEAQA